MKLTEKVFSELLSKAKYQFLLKSEKCIYFIPINKEINFTETQFIGHNETEGGVSIVDYSTIKSATVDGEHIEFK